MNMDNFVVTFHSKKLDYNSLSNFWEKDVSIKCGNYTRVYQSGEHCYQGEKYFRIAEELNDPVVQKRLFDYGKTFLKPSVYKSALEAFVGGTKGLILNQNQLKLWHYLRIEVQYDICRWKFANDDQVKTDLLSTGNKVLVHSNPMCPDNKIVDRFWDGKVVMENEKIKILGTNRLGTIWMELRN